MILETFSENIRPLRHETHTADLAVLGGGIAGVCAAIAAARQGLAVVLVQDRPVLGGNASSEIRLWILGATSHMGNNNRWAREGGIVDEILVENTRRNPEGNPVILDTLLFEMVRAEASITLLLNAAVHDCKKSAADAIASVEAFCPQTSTRHTIVAPLFVDATGDGILGYMAGAAYRIGAEARAEFGEGMAPEAASMELLGHSLYFYTKDTGKPVAYIAPDFALKDITKIPRYRDIKASDNGCKFWWFEYGGLTDTIHKTEEIKWELLKVAHGAWNHIKNSGQFPQAANLTLEWIGAIPGKRESRRFEGDTMLTQHDIIAQRAHADAVAFGGWAIDLHPSDGVYSPGPGCSQWHSKGVYQIPYRALYSRNIRNLFLAGRGISVTHIAFGSTRVMATCGVNATAVGIAAALCKKEKLAPRAIAKAPHIAELQRRILRAGGYIPQIALRESDDLARSAKITATSTLALEKLPADGPQILLDFAWAQMLPVPEGAPPRMTLTVTAKNAATLNAELRISDKPDNHTPNVTLATQSLALKPGMNTVTLDFSAARIPAQTYAFYTLLANADVTVHATQARPSGLLALCQKYNPAVAKSAAQMPPPGSGVDSFEYWCPQRRPLGHNFAFALDKPLACYSAENLTNGITRPVGQTNAWSADYDDNAPAVTFAWPSAKKICRVEIAFDTDFDHPMESAQWGHPEAVMPQCVPAYKITDATGDVLVEVAKNHRTLRAHDLVADTDKLTLHLTQRTVHTPATLFAVRVYAE